MKNMLGEEVKYNILIYAKPEKVEQKMQDVIDKKNSQLEHGEEDIDWESGWCWWDVSRLPKRKGILSVLFTDGKNVYAEGTFYGTSIDAIEFSALKRVSYLQPKVAPTRGYTYIEIDEFGRNKNAEM